MLMPTARSWSSSDSMLRSMDQRRTRAKRAPKQRRLAQVLWVVLVLILLLLLLPYLLVLLFRGATPAPPPFLWRGRSFVRKALELPLALWMDLVLPKWRVLEIYLNIAEWGPNGQFGAEAASRYAFNKSVSSLTPRESALLAAVLPNPRRRSARQPGPAVRRLAAIYEARGIAQAALAACARPAAVRASLERA